LDGNEEVCHSNTFETHEYDEISKWFQDYFKKEYNIKVSSFYIDKQKKTLFSKNIDNNLTDYDIYGTIFKEG
jgi:hypothetical protein